MRSLSRDFVLFLCDPCIPTPCSQEVFKYLKCSAIYLVASSLLVSVWAETHTHVQLCFMVSTFKMFLMPEEAVIHQVWRKSVGWSYISAAFISWGGAVSWDSAQFPFRTEKFCAVTHVDAKTSAGMHADMNTCMCVHIHRGVNESP